MCLQLWEQADKKCQMNQHWISMDATIMRLMLMLMFSTVCICWSNQPDIHINYDRSISVCFIKQCLAQKKKKETNKGKGQPQLASGHETN
jgi:hypothetical protein